MNPVYLVMVTTENNNKWYKMLPDGSYFNVEYGRIGVSGFQTARYPMSDWDKKYREKVKKGYIDQSNLVKDLIQETSPTGSTHREIEDKCIKEIVERLQKVARQTVEQNYTISSNKVTQAMVDEAQTVIYELNNNLTIEQFNKILLKLFTTIPRKMGNVNDYLSKDINDYKNIIEKEQDLLDVMKGQVVKPMSQPKVDIQSIGKTILEERGLVIEPCTDKDIETIKKTLGNCINKFYKAYKVININTENKYQQYLKDKGITKTKLLFHGTRNENVWSILQSSLVLRPNAIITGKMLGFGCYFSPTAQKSLNYSSLNGSYWSNGNSNFGFMFLFDVAYGKPYNCSSFSGMGDLTEDKLKKLDPNANCVHAHAGANLRNDEIVVYNESAYTMRYLVEFR